MDGKTCIINVGLFRSGTTTLISASKTLGMAAYRTFPDVSSSQQKEMLCNPESAVQGYVASGGFGDLLDIAKRCDIICDGWCALLPFLPVEKLKRLLDDAYNVGIKLKFIATSRDVEGTIHSELHHWVRHNLEAKADLSPDERSCLEHLLRQRTLQHKERTRNLIQIGVVSHQLPLSEMYQTWPEKLSLITLLDEERWLDSLQNAGKCNANPKLPVQGVLLTFRIGNGPVADRKAASIKALLDDLEKDSLCRYMLVVAVDDDEIGGTAAKQLCRSLEARVREKTSLLSLHITKNPPRTLSEPFAICSVWHEMAKVAWAKGADWVVLLGDDVEVRCCYHYRAIYSTFLSIAKACRMPFGFGCPWWNDLSFPGFPSFPCVGRIHYSVYGGLIPEHRRSAFVNQDLDPYLHRMYTKFYASPCISEACLVNRAGGNIRYSQARYERIPARGWKDFVTDDVKKIREHLPDDLREAVLVDVIVPSYRVRLDYLKAICSLEAPQYMQTCFIIIVDSPEALSRACAQIDPLSSVSSLAQAERILESFLATTGNLIRVRCNEKNLGASASRNRGLDESASEFVLNLDDDLIPEPDLLHQYGEKLLTIDDHVVGLVGLVRFPRNPMPLKHAAVLMSYLTFMFEIAESDIYPEGPAWGVTANILFRRNGVRFDLTYAKTGGGEDVDYSLRVSEAFEGGKLLPVPKACVVHPFWPGSVLALSSHFFNWAIGDSGLFERFPQHRYWSYPNVPETFIIFSPLAIVMGLYAYFFQVLPGFVVADFVVDALNLSEFRHRCQLVQGRCISEHPDSRGSLFYLAGHFLANLYVIVLECGRIYGHISRKNYRNGVLRRFDWHCGRLPHACRNFRRRESLKFALFVVVVSLYWPWKTGQP